MARRHSIKIPPERLPQAIQEIFDEYENEIGLTMDDVVRKVANKGAQAMRSSAQSVIGGRYATSWAYTVEKERMGSIGIIYSKVPGLPHLLENGHAKINGGRVPGRPHIAPVEKIVHEEFEKEAIKRLGEI